MMKDTVNAETVETISLVGLTPAKAATFIADCVVQFGLVRVDNFGRYGTYQHVTRLQQRLNRLGVRMECSNAGWIAVKTR
jgi:hypothetical protein